MDDLFKKFINTGVGFLSQGNKAVQKAIEKLVQESKISEQEGKKIVDDLLKSSETKRADLEKQFKTITDDLKTRVGRKGEALDAPAAPNAKAASKPAATKQSATSPAAKAPATKKPAASPTAAAAGTAKKAADKVSAAAEKAQRSTAAKAGAPKKAPILSADDSGEALNAN